jgi:GH24 family phage-related lysozyme (muramidase)
MYPSVLTAMPRLNKPLEGFVLWPYQDILGLVTIGVGCLIESQNSADRAALALPLPWVGGPTAQTIRQEFAKVDAYPKAMHFNQYRNACSLRLTEEGVDELLELRAHQFEATLIKGFPGWNDWPADAQLGVLAIAWACGPGFWVQFKNFREYANKRDWTNAARCAAIRTAGNPGVVPRNAQVALCLANSAEIDSPDGYGTPALYWPGHVASAVPPDTDPRAIPLSVQAAAAADAAMARWDIAHTGLTGHAHELDAAA